VTADELTAQVLALAALLPSSDAPTGVVLTKYRGKGSQSYREGYRAAHVMAGDAPWKYADAWGTTRAATMYARTDDEALALLHAALREALGNHEHKHDERAAVARRHAARLRAEADARDTEADDAQRHADELAAKVAAIVGGAR
jgi:CRP-like cAMP-binding protein